MVANPKYIRRPDEGASNAERNTSETAPLEVIISLTGAEHADLSRCERTISRHLTAFFEVGQALMEIQQKKLYRIESKTFEEYCRKRWDMSRVHAYRLLKAAEIRERILLPMGNISLVESERQVRPLAGLPMKLAQKAWRRAISKAGAGKPTGKMVSQAVKELSSPNIKVAEYKDEWQRLLEPLFREGLQQTTIGNREAVEEIVFKIQLKLQIGRQHVPQDAGQTRAL
jgi:hypothetical protein